MRYFCQLVAIIALLASCATKEHEPAGLVITNARVIDGSGGPERDISVRIVGDRIDALGKVEPGPSDQLIDAQGLVLAPGFIDTHSHHDDAFVELPDVLAATNQGVTTIVVGNDGSQNYPLSEFFAGLHNNPVAVNVASYAGHGTLRRIVMGENYQRHATADELRRMIELLAIEMQAGALGFSTGLEYDPGSFASLDELVQLASVAASHGGIYATHIRNEDQEFWEALDEAIEIARQAKIAVRITHMKLAIGRWWGMAKDLVELLDATRASGIDITADVYPSVAWYTDFSWFRTLFPERDLTDRAGAQYILNDMLAPDRILVPEYTPNPEYNGMTIADIAAIRESDPETTLMELLQHDAAAGGSNSGSTTIAFAMNEADIETIMAWPHTVIASDGDASGSHPRGYASFTRYLGHYIRDRQVLSLAEGVRRVSSLPAAQLGIQQRGQIREGYFADLVLFDPIAIKANATFKEPHLASSGIQTVWVNGVPVFDAGAATAARPGVVVLRPPDD